MRTITALLHTENDALRLGRCLETLYPCDDILVVDHGSRDGTIQVAHEYGARVLADMSGAASDDALRFVRQGWILCLDPRESLTESLAATLYEWKSQHADDPTVGDSTVFSIFLREETAEGWISIPTPQTRFIPFDWSHWRGRFPTNDQSAIALEGDLLRFVFP